MEWCVLFAWSSLLVSAIPSYAHNPLYRRRYGYSDLVRVQQESRDGCVIVSGTDEAAVVAMKSSPIHICEERSSISGLCFSSNLQKCCRHTGVENEVTNDHVIVASQSIRVSTLVTEKSDLCVHFGSHNFITGCLTTRNQINSGCEEPLRICASNRASSCSPSGCKICKEGYRRPSCCECDEGYAMDNGVCKRICTQNTAICGHQRCCKEGFQAPRCCECVYEHTKGGENYFRLNGLCTRICKEHALERNCNKENGCRKCEDSFQPPDCCKPSTNYQLPVRQRAMRVPLPARNAEVPRQPFTCWRFANCFGSPTMMWSSDFESDCCGGLNQPRVGESFQVIGLEQCFPCPLPPGTCESNIIRGSCNAISCRCKRGYSGNGCCACASAYIHEGNECVSCPTGTIPDEAQRECVCDQSLGTRILVNGQCMTICSSHVVRNSCGRSSCQCVPGYTGSGCCECASEYVRDGSKCVSCPTGTIPDSAQQNCICDQSQGPKSLVNGKCIAQPEARMVICWHSNRCTGSNQMIRSVTFLTDCCGSTEVQGRGMSYQIFGEESCQACPIPLTICDLNIVRGSCNANRCQCLRGYTGNGCCECASGYVRDNGRCLKCPAGIVPDAKQQRCICDQSLGTAVLVNGQCKTICPNGILHNSCNGTRCQCLPGYTGNDCCHCDEGFYREGQRCNKCSSGFIPNENQDGCICDQSQMKKILVNGKCESVCEDHILGECSGTNCTCDPGYASPDCCNCTNGNVPVDGVCPVPCLDTQNVFIILDRSSGNSETELSNAVFMTQMLAGGMLRSTKNVNVTVLAYANSEDSLTLEEFMPVTTSGPTVTKQSCLLKLIAYAEEIYSHERPKNTLADKTMELLKPYIQTGVPNTVITFAGTVSDFQNHNPVDRIVKAINEMKGRNNVRFFSAGFEGENGELERYQNQVLALANNKRSQSVLSEDPVTLMEDLTDSLVSHGVFCKDQAKIIKTLVGQSEVYKRYNRCQDQNAEIILFNSKYTPCIDKTPFRDSCRRASTVKSFLLAMMNQLLKLE